MGRNFLYYLISGTVIGLVLQAIGADLTTVLLASLLGPPLLLLLFLVARRRHMF